MFRQVFKALVLVGVTGAIALPMLSASANAQDIAPAAPSNQYAIAAGDVATSAVAQLNDTAEDAKVQHKIELYKQLMELNGVSRNVRQVITNTKIATRLVVIDRAGLTALTPEQDARYNKIADTILIQTQNDLIEHIAEAQAPNFSLDEIQQLITANSSIAAAKYNAGKFMSQDDSAAQVQNYMIEAVIRIIKTFTASQAS
ncbi:hypothetical protein AEAC466_01865 [Asticcacaulis sp. AC466]|uniref:hypothetical protein n=1 Tax=Asticcacaulis sp. AC466 TaxID=1282362 RepID=UPI0003C3E234|nr:hypothetical protein [Asticcacaulis sp. AC466]ESQ85953.1 hypothetical protein AEAC466_01865 [Asticcacaulis sp. AC466]